MADHVEITLWIDRRWKDAIEKHLRNETLREHLEDVLDELCSQLPEREYERISAEIYAEDRLCDTLELCLCKADGTEENWSYQLNAAEREVLLRKMEEYCQKQTGMSLHDYAQQFREEPEQQPGPVMKL